MLADDAFETYYLQHRDGLVRYIASRVRDRTAAQDITQEVYTKAYRNRERFDADRSFTAWIYTIARNACIDYLRRRVRDPLSAVAPNAPVDGPDLDAFPQGGADADPQVVAERKDLIVAVRRELAQLPEQRRIAIEMKIVDGLTYRETAEILGVPLGTVAFWVRESLEAVALRLKHLQ
ncbi:MAG: sigma-70 family RNA polymerase sigma factor [Planctomycetota bacterium]